MQHDDNKNSNELGLNTTFQHKTRLDEATDIRSHHLTTHMTRPRLGRGERSRERAGEGEVRARQGEREREGEEGRGKREI